MKNVFTLSLTLLIILFITTGCGILQSKLTQEENPGIHELPPHLEVHLYNTNSAHFQGQTITVIQLRMSWLYYDENGVGRGIEADAAHPLQMKPNAFTDEAVNLSNVRCDCIEGKDHIAIELRFGNDYPPESFSVIRWNFDLVSGEQDIDELINLGERVEANGYIISIYDDGIDYLYAVYANWPEGRSDYAFKTSVY